MGAPANDTTIKIPKIYSINRKTLNPVISRVRRPIIVNGKLLMEGNKLIVAYNESFTLKFALGDHDKKSPAMSDQDALKCLAKIESELNEFEYKYGSLNPQYNTSSIEREPFLEADSFTYAIIIQSSTFSALADKNVHKVGRQLNSVSANLLRQFMNEYVVNYFDIYSILFSKRIRSSRMNSVTRGHLVAGLCQPLIVGTNFIQSPFLYGECEWFADMFRQEGSMISLTQQSDMAARRLDLSCIPMCDIVAKFRCKNIHDLGNREWMFFALACTLASFNYGDNVVDKFKNLMERNKILFARILKDEDLRLMLTQMLEYCRSRSNALVAR